MNPGGKKVELGAGAGNLGDFFLAAYKSGLRPVSISIENTRPFSDTPA